MSGLAIGVVEGLTVTRMPEAPQHAHLAELKMGSQLGGDRSTVVYSLQGSFLKAAPHRTSSIADLSGYCHGKGYTDLLPAQDPG